MRDFREYLDETARAKIKKKKQPGWTSPMKATLTHDYFSDPEWLFERKFDGVRCLAFKSGSGLKIMSRNKKELNDTYPELVAPLRTQKPDSYIADGEIVTFDGDVTSF